MAMALITARDKIKAVRERFDRTYPGLDGSRVSWAPYRRLGEIRSDLAALDLDTCSGEDIEKVIGGSGWGTIWCEACEIKADKLAVLKTDAYETTAICHACAERALKLLTVGHE